MTTPPQDPFAPQPEQGPGSPHASGSAYGTPGPSQPWSGTGSYGPPPQAWGGGPGGGAPKTETKAVIALVCAIGAWVVLPVLPAIAALMVGSSARRDIAASGGWLTGDGLVTAAKVIAWANLVVFVLAIVLFGLALGLFATTSSTSAHVG